MRTREKAKIFKRFLAGDSVERISWRERQEDRHVTTDVIESIIREGITGKFDVTPMKREYAPRECSAPCCFCGVTDTDVETATTGTPMHRQCLRLAALGSLESSIMPNSVLDRNDPPNTERKL